MSLAQKQDKSIVEINILLLLLDTRVNVFN